MIFYGNLIIFQFPISLFTKTKQIHFNRVIKVVAWALSHTLYIFKQVKQVTRKQAPCECYNGVNMVSEKDFDPAVNNFARRVPKIGPIRARQDHAALAAAATLCVRGSAIAGSQCLDGRGSGAVIARSNIPVPVPASTHHGNKTTSPLPEQRQPAGASGEATRCRPILQCRQ